MQDLLGLLAPAEFRPGTPLADAVGRASAALRDAGPMALVLIDTAWRPRTFAIPAAAILSDGTGAFHCPLDSELASVLHETAIEYGLPSVREEMALSPGAAAALQALSPSIDLPIVPLGVPTASPGLLHEFGQALHQSAERTGRRVVAIAVGALARDLQALHGGTENPAVGRFGREVLSRLDQGSAEQLFEIDGALWIAARPETDLGHLSLLLGYTTPDAKVEVLGSEEQPGLFSAMLAFFAPEHLPPLGGSGWADAQRAWPAS